MKILIRGAGDLATGIAVRLYHCGHQIVMTEKAVPLTVRRTVAFSRAVYEEQAVVEGITAVLARSEKEISEILSQGLIAVCVDPEAAVGGWFRPDVLVDAVLAKKNLGTAVTDAPFVVGVGPGFTAGTDCHCVVETKRGHMLGRVIWEGSAIPNTGIPGEVGGYTVERLLRAPAEGRLYPLCRIGDYVEKGQTVALAGGKRTVAEMSGIVRGMLQPGVWVWEGLKIGDIDARCEKSHCKTVSDKARAIGGGVLEAIQCFEAMRGKYAAVVLAAGAGTRFGGKKLLADIKGKPMFLHTFEALAPFTELPVAVVTGEKEIAEACRRFGYAAVENKEPEQGISFSLRKGLEYVREQMPEVEGILFLVCDQPGIRTSFLQKMWNQAIVRRGKILCASHRGKRGNPVFFSRCFFEDLEMLRGDQGGRVLFEKYPEHLVLVEAPEDCLIDIDRKEDAVRF